MPDYYTSNEYLTESEMQVNALYIKNYLMGEGWTLNAVCGLLGNTQTESTHNPGLWQGRREPYSDLNTGFSLTQWTPASKYVDWCNQNSLVPEQMDSALKRILYELENNIQYYATDEYPLSFSEFSQSTASAHYLGAAWLLNYERPTDQSVDNQNKRGNQAEAWYTYFEGQPPGPDPPGPRTYKKLPVYMMIHRRRIGGVR